MSASPTAPAHTASESAVPGEFLPNLAGGVANEPAAGSFGEAPRITKRAAFYPVARCNMCGQDFIGAVTATRCLTCDAQGPLPYGQRPTRMVAALNILAAMGRHRDGP